MEVLNFKPDFPILGQQKKFLFASFPHPTLRICSSRQFVVSCNGDFDPMKASSVLWGLLMACLSACYSSPLAGTTSSDREFVPFKSDTLMKFDQLEVYLGQENLGKIIVDSLGKYYLDVTHLKQTKDYIRQYGCVGKLDGKNIVQLYDDRESVLPPRPEKKDYYFARSLYRNEKMNRHHPYSRYNILLDSLKIADQDSIHWWIKKQTDSLAGK